MYDTSSQLEDFRTRAQGTNVNAVSLLATDYLNHFNEALMLAELMVDMPDMIDDFAAWSPKHYKDHFQESGIADRQLALEAYDHSPPEFRLGFDATVAQLNEEIIDLQRHFTKGVAVMPAPSQDLVQETCGLLRGLIDRAGSIINGQPATGAPSGERLEQDDIDALFD